MNGNTDHERELRQRWMNLRTIDEVEERHLHDLAHLQPVSRIDGSIVMQHDLEAVDPERSKKRTVNHQTQWAKAEQYHKYTLRNNDNLIRWIYLHSNLGLEEIVDRVDGRVLEKPIHGKNERHQD